jgi:hypothetical protein
MATNPSAASAGRMAAMGMVAARIAQAIHLRVSRFRVVTRRNQVCVTRRAAVHPQEEPDSE